MPKTRKEANTELPDVVKDALSLPAAGDAEPAQSPPEDGPPVLQAVNIDVPLAPLDAGYQTRHVEARLNTELQRQTLRRLTHGLRQAGESLADGKRVTSYGDAVKWVIEQVGFAAETKDA